MMAPDLALKNEMEKNSFHPALKIIAKIISFIFHPLFIPLYVFWFLIYDLRLFTGISDWDKTKVMISIFVNYTLLPLATILLMKALGFIQSVYLKTQRDRILPYVVCQIFYFWAWYVAKNLPHPKLVVLFALAIFIAAALGLIFNIYIKISMHAMSLGVVSAFLLMSGLMGDSNFGPYITIAFLVAGITCTARLIASDHSSKEIYAGFFVGVFSQLIAYLFV